MSIKKIEKLLTRALLNDGEMEYALYEHELEEILDHMKKSMADDKDDYIFTVTENNGDVAMVLIEKSGEIYIDEQARERLQLYWPATYEQNMKGFIPHFARQLSMMDFPITGGKVEDG